MSSVSSLTAYCCRRKTYSISWFVIRTPLGAYGFAIVQTKTQILCKCEWVLRVGDQSFVVPTAVLLPGHLTCGHWHVSGKANSCARATEPNSGRRQYKNRIL
jgi:hypothetical protein